MRSVMTKMCPSCGCVNTVQLTDSEYKQFVRWQKGEIYIQDIGLDTDISEMFISGFCPTCWNEFFE